MPKKLTDLQLIDLQWEEDAMEIMAKLDGITKRERAALRLKISEVCDEIRDTIREQEGDQVQ